MKENVNISHDIRHFGHAEAFHTQTFAVYEQVEDSEITFFLPLSPYYSFCNQKQYKTCRTNEANKPVIELNNYFPLDSAKTFESQSQVPFFPSHNIGTEKPFLRFLYTNKLLIRKIKMLQTTVS